MQVHALARVVAGTALSMLIMVAATAVSAQTWEYKAYKKTLGGQFSKENFVVGSITLEEKDGKAMLRTIAGAMDACRRSELPALVTRTDAEITIEPDVPMAGCERWRVVIRNDGSGGRREVWRGERWVDTKWDHGLTPKK